MERKKAKTAIIKKDPAPKEDALKLNNQVKSNESEVLVLDEMIE